MPRKKRSEFAAGLFVLVALAAAVGVVVWLGAADMLRPARWKAVFYVNEASGSVRLEVGGVVQLNDDPVGKLTEVRFDPKVGRTFYVAQIDRDDVRIRADGRAIADAGFIGGARLVVTSRGSADKPLADEKNPIELSPGGFAGALAAINQEFDRSDDASMMGKIHDILNGLTTAAGDVAAITGSLRKETDPRHAETLLNKIHTGVEDLQAVTASIRREMTPDEKDSTLARVRKSADDLNRITADIRTQTDVKAEGSAVAKVHGSLDDMNQITADARPKIQQTLTAVNSAAGNIEGYTKKDFAEILATLRRTNTKVLKIATDFGEVSGQVKEMVTVNRDRIDEMIDNMTLVSADLKATAKDVRRAPWRLLHKPDKKEIDSQNIYDAARAFSSGAEQLDQAIIKLTGLAKAHPEGVAAKDPQFLKIREQIEKSFTEFTKVENAFWKELVRQPGP